MVALLLAFASATHAAISLDEVQVVSQRGAHDTAMQLFQRHPPDRLEAAEEWLGWQHAYVELMVQHAEWRRLIDHADATARTAGGIPDWMSRAAINAYMQLDEPQRARTRLRALLWQPQPKGAGELLRHARREVIRSYLLERRAEDAYIALLRYWQEFRDDSSEWLQLSVETLFESERYMELLRLLEVSAPSSEFASLQLMAQLRSGMKTPQQAIVAARAALASSKGTQQRDYWGVIAEAAGDSGALSERVEALEHYLLSGGVSRYGYNGDTLWSTYRTYGEALGNSAQLLFGQFDEWLVEAERLSEQQPLQARALYALVAIDGGSSDIQRVAQHRLAALVDTLPDGGGLLQQLFLESGRFDQIDTIPASVRSRMLRYAATERDFALLARLAPSFGEVPEGIDLQRWRLLWAELKIGVGEWRAALEALQHSATDSEAMSGEAFAQLLSLLTKIEGGASRPSVDALLLQLLQRGDIEPQQRLRLLMARGDLARSAGDPAGAVVIYLSISSSDASATEARVALFAAADTLAEAGVVEDARRLYRSLLESSGDAVERGLIERSLQQFKSTPPSMR